MPPFDTKLLDLIVCPVSKGRLSYDADKNALVSLKGNLVYPIKEGIPILLPEEAQPYAPEDQGKP